jgi:hypothetical protein
LDIAIYSEVGENCLVASSLCFTDICHLDCFLTKLPFIPIVIRIEVFLDEVRGSFHSFIEHKSIVEVSLNCLVDKTEFDLS